MATFTPPADNLVPPIAVDSRDVTDPLAQKLFRYYKSRPRGRNVFILTNNTVTEDLPASSYNADGTLNTEAWSQVSRVFYGGHIGYQISASEQSILTAAGYGAYIQ